MENHKKRERKVRQDWKPNLLVRTIYNVWRVVYGALQVVLGAIATVGLICVVCGFVFVSVLGDYLVEDVMAKAEFNLENYDLEKTSYIHYLDEDGNVQILQQLSTTTDRQWVKFEDIPEDLIHAAVAIEDKRFYVHQGVDWITTVKACANMFFGSASAGGSTLTQQLIKNLKLTEDSSADDVTVYRKVLEIFRAFAFEQAYDKETVIEWYMNTVYFGEGCYGVKSAAANYFGKELQDMNTAELAALIGITNNPSMFNPYSTREYPLPGQEEKRDGAGRNQYRQKVVLTQMYEQGWLTEEAYLDAYYYEMTYKRGIDAQDRWNECRDVLDASGNMVVKGCGYKGPVRDLIAQESNGTTNYFCPACHQKIDITTDASQTVYSWYVDTVLEDVAKAMALEDGVEEWNVNIRYNYVNVICRAGYHIYTPYNASVQAAVDNIYTDLSKIPETKGAQQLLSAIVIVDNRTGDLVAMAGNVGKKTVSDAWNIATDSPQQVGSSLKPLTVYAPAFESGKVTPATVLEDLPFMFNGENPYPHNDSRVYNYHRTVYHGIIQSLNAISVNTLDLMGTQYSFNFAKYKFRISDLLEKRVTASGAVLSDIDIAPLGMGALTDGVTVRDVATAYATFTNDGVYREARTFLAVLDSTGNVVLSNVQESEKILSTKTCDYINYCLDSAVSSGTGTVADLYEELGMDVAGKTGTTGNNMDRYFVGYTGYYTAAVWCGFEFDEVINLVGDTTNPAARLWKAVMLQVHEGKETIPLYNSSNMVEVEICVDSGMLACDACRADIRRESIGLSRTVRVLVYPEDAPTAYCNKHIVMDYCVTGQGVANEYCQHFAQYGVLKLEQKALVKITQATLEKMQLTGQFLSKNYKRSDYIYLVDNKGNDAAFFGFNNDINEGLNVPYDVCTLHTLEAWEQYKAENPWIDGGTPEETLPTEPVPGTSEPSVPTETTQPVEPTQPEEGGEDSDWLDDLLDSILGN